MSVETATLAVGNPIVRPRWSPSTTGPLISWFRPSILAAASTSPAPSARRIAVDETESVVVLACGRSWMPSTANPCFSPSLASRSTSPVRSLPKWKSAPTTTARAFIRSTTIPATNSSAVSWARVASNGTTRAVSTPHAASRSSFCSRSVINAGAESGRSTVAG